MNQSLSPSISVAPKSLTSFPPSVDQDNVLVIGGKGLTCQELWTEQTSERRLQDLRPLAKLQDPTKPNNQLANLEDIETYCTGFSKLQIPYVLDDQKLSSQIRLKKIEIGSIHCLFLTEDGFVYGLGQNVFGQLLNYNQDHLLCQDDVTLPTLLLWFVERNIRIRDIACAGWFSAFVTTDGQLYTVGRFGASSSSATEPVLQSSKGCISTFGLGNEQLVFQCDSPHGDDQVYSLGSNSHGQLGVEPRVVAYADEAVEAQIVNPSSSDNSRKPFNFCRLTKIRGGEHFMTVLTSHGDVYVAGHIDSLNNIHGVNGSNGFVKLDLRLLGTALVQDFSCSWHDIIFVDSMKRVFTSSSLFKTNQTLRYFDASTIEIPKVTARARDFHVVDARTGRLFNPRQTQLDSSLKLEELQASSHCSQLLGHPNYQVASYASGYYVHMVLLRRVASTTSLLFFMTNLKDFSISRSQFSDVTFVFQ